MRDIMLLGFIASCLLLTLRYPFVGLLLWAWFTLATPQQAAYAAKDIPLNLIIAGFVFVTFFFHKEFKKLRFDVVTTMLVGFSIWLLISQHQSLVPDRSAEFTDRFFKIMIFIFLITQVVTSKLRFHAVLWSLVMIMGFYGAKGGIYTIVKLGAGTYAGQIDTVLYDNNHMAIALAATLPMFLYVAGIVQNPIMRWGIQFVFLMSIMAILGTHSRGGLLALMAFFGYNWVRSSKKTKAISLVFMAIMIVPVLNILPEKWFERMETIGSAGEDASFQGRVDAWVINYKLANKYPITGTGLRNPYKEDVSREVEMHREPRAAHSIYFEVLGGMGYVGLAFYLGMLGLGWLKAFQAERKYRDEKHNRWRARFGHYAQISIFVFCAGGSSVSLEMWEGYLIIIALIATLPFIDHEAEFMRKGHAIEKVRERIKAKQQQFST